MIVSSFITSSEELSLVITEYRKIAPSLPLMEHLHFSDRGIIRDQGIF